MANKAPLRTITRMVNGFIEDDGFILSGYLAYLALLALFPFFIFMVSLAGYVGRQMTLDNLTEFLDSLPPAVSAALAGPLDQAMRHAHGGVLTFGVLVSIWTVGSLIETFRVVIHKAYNIPAGRPFWQYRLQSFVMVIGSSLLLLAAMTTQFMLGGVSRYMADHLPLASNAIHLVKQARQIFTPLVLFVALYVLDRVLVPRSVRPTVHWPGAMLTVLVWMLTASLLPGILSEFGSYDITYGSLAGVMVTLLFFYIIGTGFVLGAQLNAAIKQTYYETTPTL